MLGHASAQLGQELRIATHVSKHVEWRVGHMGRRENVHLVVVEHACVVDESLVWTSVEEDGVPLFAVPNAAVCDGLALGCERVSYLDPLAEDTIDVRGTQDATVHVCHEDDPLVVAVVAFRPRCRSLPLHVAALLLYRQAPGSRSG